MSHFRLGDVVRLKKTGERFDVLGVEDGGKNFYIMSRSSPFSNAIWVTVDEIEIYP